VQLEELRSFWTKVLGVDGPQWMIVMALYHLDQGEGASVQAIAHLLHANPSFVTSQARFLESKGLIQRKPEDENPEAITLSLTGQAREHLAELALPKKA
jgi:DNA-binding MarR family transcriptional regulator